MKFNMCRCCLINSCYKGLFNEYYFAGHIEIYSQMLLETFNITLHDNSHKMLICEDCILKLRAATTFKKQVLDAEEKLRLSLINIEDSQEPVVAKEEIAFDCNFDDQSATGDDAECEHHHIDEADDFDDSINWDKQNGEIFVIKVEPEDSENVKKEKQSTKKENVMKKNKHTPSLNKKSLKCHVKENSLKLILNSNMCLFDSLRTKFKCFCCQDAFINITELREHSKTHSNLKRIKSRLNALRGASFRNVDISNLECKLCSDKCTNLDDLKNHLAIHDVKFHDTGHFLIPYKLEKEFRCVDCGQEFNTFTRLNIHMNTHYRFNVCEICGASFISTLSLRNHLKAIHKEQKCTFCPEKFSTLHAKMKHMRKAHKTSESKRYCRLCDKTFRYTYLLFDHNVKEHGAKRQISECTICGKTFLSPQNLRVHTRNVHVRERNYQCSICELRFFTKFDQKRHEKTHEDVKSFSCSYCEGKFKSKDSLRRHLWRQHVVPLERKK
ncbi:gastrula zinc finger protein XlCGF57.1 isoform X2 [Amyelois transitella]|uniref:gastrula zinc finger protein XlCGF57.1 isoform X2 n=1 Tax=Amyelois transitella TaxID=680683 RepID=UPI00298FE534|nr:gastrula zinc finger protein XlCGF57.1 isoform X2 [Amyelois transitella]